MQAQELDIEAIISNLQKVQSFVREQVKTVPCPMRVLMQIDIAVEEIFINIASYAYIPKKGRATIRVEVTEDPASVTISFADKGIPYNPLAKEDPDISLPVSERRIGGLGVFMTKKIMDSVSYEHRDGKNILTMKKNL